MLTRLLETVRSSLKVKLMLAIAGLCLFMVAVTMLVTEQHIRRSILSEFDQRGQSIGSNLAAVNRSYVTTYNYVNLQQSVSSLQRESGLAYAAIQLIDGEVAAFAGDSRHRGGLGVLVEAQDWRALEESAGVLREMDDQVGHFVAPIFVAGEPWAAARIGISLGPLNRAIVRNRQHLLAVGALVLALGLICSHLLARRVTRPVSDLVCGVDAVSRGDFGSDIRVSTHDEIGHLGRRFSAMRDELREHIGLLESTNSQLISTNARLQHLFDASNAVTLERDRNSLYDVLLGASLETSGALCAGLVLNSSEGEGLVRLRKAAADQALPAVDYLQRYLGIGGFGGRQMATEPPELAVGHLLNCEAGHAKLVSMEFPDFEVVNLRLKGADAQLGTLSLVRPKSDESNAKAECRMLSILAGHVSASLDNLRLYSRLEDAYLSTVKSLNKSIEFKDEYTHGHSERVADLCEVVAEYMGLPEEEVRVLRNAALLHDIGKIGVLEQILNKRSRLSSSEWESIKKHPVIGAEILAPISTLARERRIVLRHHERVDGKGYPHGVPGRRLSLSERIIIVADAFDAMNSLRAYRKQLTPESIRNEIVANSGSQFDPEVAGVFLELFDSLIAGSGKVVRFDSAAGGSYGGEV